MDSKLLHSSIRIHFLFSHSRNRSPSNRASKLAQFNSFSNSLDLSSERKIFDIKNRIEATIVIWKRKMNAKDSKSSWSSSVSLEKREVFEDRAQTVLVILKHRFPGIPQSALDTSKIQCNRDVGQAILESYSRIIQSLALIVLSRIDDVIRADSLVKDPLSEEKLLFPLYHKYPSFVKGLNIFSNSKEEPEKLDLAETPILMTLLDFIGWNSENGEKGMKKDLIREMSLGKLSNVIGSKKVSYIEVRQHEMRTYKIGKMVMTIDQNKW